jgi:6-phosphogluconolactonase/glucosamine-6-phosphate isomerase/deaminase
MKIEVVVNQESVAENAASIIASEARAAALDRGIFVMAVSGGHTPWSEASAPLKELQRKLGFEPGRLVAVAKGLLSKG